jgi:hypothetical protein
MNPLRCGIAVTIFLWVTVARTLFLSITAVWEWQVFSHDKYLHCTSLICIVRFQINCSLNSWTSVTIDTSNSYFSLTIPEAIFFFGTSNFFFRYCLVLRIISTNTNDLRISTRSTLLMTIALYSTQKIAWRRQSFTRRCALFKRTITLFGHIVGLQDVRFAMGDEVG